MGQVVAAVAGLWGLSACTQVIISADPEDVEIARHWGTVSVTVKPSSNSSVVNVKGLGFVGTPLSNSFGYHNGSFASLEEDCRVVMWIENEDRAMALAALLTGNDQVCVEKR